MAINGHRNKPIGPGGSTRRLHHQFIGHVSSSKYFDVPHRSDLPIGLSSELLMGANQHRRRRKGCAFARHGTRRYRAKSIVANDNYAEARLAA